MIGLLIKPNEKNIEVLESDSFDYKYIQRLVGGTFDVPYLSKSLDERNIDCFINDEGKFLDVGISAVIVDDNDKMLDFIKSNILIVGHESEETVGLTKEQYNYLINEYLQYAILSNPNTGKQFIVFNFRP